jgi:hypothetical protein
MSNSISLILIYSYQGISIKIDIQNDILINVIKSGVGDLDI